MTRLRLGVSACFFHADPLRAVFKGKTLLYAEESLLRWLMTEGVVPALLPRASGAVSVDDLVDGIDGLVLAGGSDMSPLNYDEQPAQPEWGGDAARDLYELELARACVRRNKPVLGVCRGLQVLNVCFGGSLYQDIETMHPQGLVHRNWEVYDQLFHDVALTPNGFLSDLYGGPRTARVTSVHHQGIKRLGRDLLVEAVSTNDQMVEAIRLGGGEAFVLGVQWHPEFQDAEDPELLSSRVLLQGFLNEVRRRRA
ncbi:MAG TPA: gamma-glutamyl-gamma-aminobutyrate hydrolase family protein [Polyangiaceae bacterium]|nr:gamma-glutamyl-gamma-aminobutyrate hydrolase family protein [Polyangiaceae bacterium]